MKIVVIPIFLFVLVILVAIIIGFVLIISSLVKTERSPDRRDEAESAQELYRTMEGMGKRVERIETILIERRKDNLSQQIDDLESENKSE